MDDNSGLGILIIPVGILLVIGLIGGAVWLTNSIAAAKDAEAARINAQAHLVYQQGQARAMVIEAQGQARLDSAAAFSERTLSASNAFVISLAGLTGAAIPWLVTLAIVLVIVMVVAAIIRSEPVVIEARQQPRLIERQIILVLQPGQSRRQLYGLLSAGSDVEMAGLRRETNGDFTG